MGKGIQLFNIGNTPTEVRITRARRSLLYFAKTFFKGIKISSSQETMIHKLDKQKRRKKMGDLADDVYNLFINPGINPNNLYEEEEMEQDKDYKVTHEFFIAGIRFHELDTVIDEIAEDDHLVLIPEPSNKFDPNAIKIEFLGAMLGYIPKKHSSEVCAMFEVGKELECVLTKLNKDAKPWEKVKVEVREML